MLLTLAIRQTEGAICCDIEVPETTAILAFHGADVGPAPTALMPPCVGGASICGSDGAVSAKAGSGAAPLVATIDPAHQARVRSGEPSPADRPPDRCRRWTA